MDFLPSDYKNPNETSRYTRLQDGENMLRILSSATIGWEDWDDERSVHRFRMSDRPTKSLSSKPDAKIKHFWAFIVWNYAEKSVQICNVTQASIQKALRAIVRNPKWGDPKEYDIVITRSGKDLQTEYAVTPEPKEKLAKEIEEEYKSLSINMDALYEGLDPFNSSPVGNDSVDPDSIPEDL